jgi:precorrin-6Y C5,15-methyltransferase (decarboxylating)
VEGEQALMALHADRGGELVRLAVQRAEPVGGLTGWRPMMPVTQWRAVKP